MPEGAYDFEYMLPRACVPYILVPLFKIYASYFLAIK